MLSFDDYELGRTDDMVQIDTREQNHDAVTKMAQQSKNTIEIISRELDPSLYDTEDFVDAVKQMVINNQRSKVRILVYEPKAIAQKGHRLVELAKTLPSYIKIHVPGHEFKGFNESLFIADTTAYVHRLNTERFEGSVNFNDKRLSKYLLNQFEQMWEKATPDSNFRQMHI